MFNKSIKKIVIMVMSFLLVFLIATFTIIYLTSFYQTKSDNNEILVRYSESYNLVEGAFGPGEGFKQGNQFGDKPMNMPGEEPGEEPGEGEVPAIPGDTGAGEGNTDDRGDGPKDFNGQRDTFRPDATMRLRNMDNLSTFYSVVFDSNNEVVNIDNNFAFIHSNNELVAKAKEVLSKNKDSGSSGVLSYLITERNGYTLVAFMDNTITNNNFRTFLVVMLVAGGGALVIAFFISLAIARKIVKPLEENDKRQKQFVSDAGHELKTPITIINANAELLEREISNNEWLNNIKYENERMKLLVTELLDLNRAEGKASPHEKLDLSRLVTGEVLPFETLAFENGLEIASNIENGIMVNGNAGELKKLVSILLDNAIKYSEGGNTINLSLKVEHKDALLVVENFAPNIPDDKLNRLFERFYRVDEARNSEGSHYGLGLAIAKAIVEGHKGEISVKSENEKVKFFIHIPL